MTSPRAERLAARRLRGARAHSEGHGAEVLAAFWLMLRGYRIVGFRTRLSGVEVDLVARRGAVVVLVEVKRRADLSAAVAAVGPEQRRRLRRAGLALAERGRRHGGEPPAVRLDLIALAPGRWPRHVRDAWAGADEGEGRPWR